MQQFRSFVGPTSKMVSTHFELSTRLSYVALQSKHFSSKKSVGNKKQDKATEVPSFENLVDADANLTHELLVSDVPTHISKAAKVGVCAMVIPGSTVGESVAAIKLCRQFGGSVKLFPTVGVHPYCASNPLEDLPMLSGATDLQTQIRSVISSNEENVVAVGECGLDYSDGFPSREVQLACFKPQVAVACERNLPLFLHERLAHSDFLSVLDKYQGRLPRVLVHCFTGTTEELKEYITRGYYVSFSGIIRKNNSAGKALREVIRACDLPLGKVMVETDAPYLGFPGCRTGYDEHSRKQTPNVPSALPFVVQTLAECMGVCEKELAAATTRNAESFFGRAMSTK